MIFYITPIVVGFILYYYEVKRGSSFFSNTSFKSAFIFVSAFIYCGGYMTGSDWVNYELLYNNASLTEIRYYTKELGFYYFVLFFKWLGLGFFPFLLFCKFIVFYIIVDFLKRNFKSIYLPLSIFLASNALFIFVDNPLRFMLAMGIIVISFKYLLERKIIPYFLLVMLATTFHISSIIIFIVYFASGIIQLKKIYSIFIYIAFTILLTPQLLGDLIDKYLLPYINYLDYYLNRIAEQDSNLFSIGKIVYLFLFIVVVLNRDNIINSNAKGNYIYKLTIIYFYFLLFALIPTMFRLSIFLTPFFYLSISIIINNQIRYKYFIRFFIIAYFIISPITKIYSTWVYIPYSNYFVSLITNDLKDYQYRVNYNKLKYYEKNKEWKD